MTPFDWSNYDAALFDLDGVLTDTATVHAAAWKRAFDGFLEHWAYRTGIAQHPFDSDREYRAYVDGRARADGVATFLASRGIELPEGDPGDPPGYDTVWGVGNRKNEMVAEVLATVGVEPYAGSLALLDHLAEISLPMAVVSASANAGAVLESAGIEDRFAHRVDGMVAADLGLAGKPAPDLFLEAARRLAIHPIRGVVVEDAVAGIRAGVAGGFGAVIGVDRHQDPESLTEAGATVVIADLAELVP